MWIITGSASIAFICIAGVYAAKYDERKYLFSTCSSACTALTLLFEYYAAVSWTKAADWSAMLDTVPSIYPLLVIYTVIMIAVNLFISVKK